MVAGNLARKMNTTPEPEVHISESPVKWCSVSLSDMVSRGKRLEASVFDVEAKQARESVYKGKYGTVILYGNSGLIEQPIILAGCNEADSSGYGVISHMARGFIFLHR